MTTTNEQTRPAFGARIRVSATLHRCRRGGDKRWVYVKWWEPRPLSAPRDGLYIGCRTLSNGYTDFVGEEEGYWFVPESHFAAALVVFSERERPVLVPFDAIEAVQL